MKKTLLPVCLIGCSLVAYAQNKLTPPTWYRAYEYMELHKQPATIGSHVNSTESAIPVETVLISLEDGFSANDLRKIEYLTVDDELGTCIIARVPVNNLMDLNNEICIRRVEISRKLNPDMNYARPSGQVESVQEGFSYQGQTLSFDGSGVIVGMMDTGLEANHVNFRNSDGTTRIQRLWWMNSNNGSYQEYTPSDISSFTTDNTGESHATHVAGIMGGSYKGNGTYSYMATATGTSPSIMTDEPIPYYGVATGADFALSVGELYTSNILQGVRNVIDYAESVGKPCVVNLSLGHTTGPHDGSDTYSSELARLGERGIICMSAGNDGDTNISITKDITSSTGNDAALRTFILGNPSANNVINGVVDLWGTDNTILTLQWGVYSVSSQTFTPILTINQAYQQESTSGVAAFNNYFNGSIVAQSYVDSNNNRFEVYTTFSSVVAQDSDKAIALYVTGAKSGQKLYLYSSTRTLTFSYTPNSSSSIVDGYTNGSAANSINDGACAKNVIAVGAYVSRTTCGVLQPGYFMPAATGFNVGAIAPFSSYGTAFDGTSLPDVCAPGARIVSSYSRYYVSGENLAQNMVARTANGSVTDYWGAMNGTSMSCPFVTGTIGLWLQADPTLTYERVMDVITNSSDFNRLTMRPAARWGAGKINAQKGMEYVLANRAAIGQVWEDDNQRLIVTPTGAGYDVFVADGGAVTATLYDLQGRPVAKAAGADGSVSVDAPQTGHGVYILEVRGADYRLTRKLTR